MLVVALVVVATAIATLSQRAGAHEALLGAPVQPPPLHQPLPAASRAPSPGASDDPVHGLDSTIRTGTCFSVSPNQGGGETYTQQACAAQHSDEFVGFERATGSGDAYPDDAYWNGPVAEQCYQDVLAYTGLPRDAWPEGLGAAQFRPTHEGWAAGDRTVYCTARWTPVRAGSARNLTPATTGPVRPDASLPGGDGRLAPPASVEVTRTGVLTVIAAPADAAGSHQCLALQSSDGWWLVQAGSSRYSWTATLNLDGSVDSERSGLIAGSDLSGPVGWHAGATVTLTGASFPADDAASSTCGLHAAIYVTDVR
jgi:hypothetical protein